MKLIQLSRDEYLESVMQIDDFASLKFSKQALDWWDDYYSWVKFPPFCLVHNEEHLCYIFYNISKDNQYLTLHNIFTPVKHRFHGFAYNLLDMIFFKLANNDIARFKMHCVSSSIEFYNTLGLNYWGVNEIGQYYCDFKMPKVSINEIEKIVNNSSINDFSDESILTIYDKLKLNGVEFEAKESDIHNDIVKKLGNKYLFKSLQTKAISLEI